MKDKLKNGRNQYRLTPEELLLEQNLALRQEIKELKMIHQNIWMLLVVVGRRLQMTSASVKAAVTSLLGRDIFWDVSTEHEFLQTINESTDYFSDLSMLVSLVSRLQTGKIQINQEPHTLQEILSKLEDELSQRIEKLTFGVEYPRDGASVLVDYEYMMIALRLLFEAMAGDQDHSVKIQVVMEQMDDSWRLEIHNGGTLSVYKLICNLSDNLTEEFLQTEQISPELALKIYTAFKIFSLQNIQIQACEDKANNAFIELAIPIL
jgi:K+-sensing histidine kinase KdpD